MTTAKTTTHESEKQFDSSSMECSNKELITGTMPGWVLLIGWLLGIILVDLVEALFWTLMHTAGAMVAKHDFECPKRPAHYLV
jgi:hypothetical protein